MAHAVTHVLIVVILLSLFRDYIINDKKKFSLHYVIIGGIATLLPDLDIAVYYLLSFFGFTLQEVHRTFSHNLTVAAIFLIWAFIFLLWEKAKTPQKIKMNKKDLNATQSRLKKSTIFFIITFAILVHLAIDWTTGNIILFYPFSTFALGLNALSWFPEGWRESITPSIDAVLFISWLIYLEWKHKISDFI
jgi:membrane-bound metal-dependent hydrolase YbcI (DUF457 family)